METKTIKADMFIVPNPSIRFGGDGQPTDREFLDKERERYEQGWGIVPQIGDRLIQVWVTNKEVENFADHYYVLQEQGDFTAVFPCHIPSKVLEGKDEGDTITFEGVGANKNVTLVVTLKQNKYRYRENGTLKQLVESL